MPKVFTSKTQKIGELGEYYVTKFLMKQGFTIVERNFTMKWGEIDIVVTKENRLHFIEVKTVTQKNFDKFNVLDQYRPEDNMHKQKIKRLSRTIQTYISTKKLSYDIDWQVDLAIVYFNFQNKKYKIKFVKDIIL